MRRRGRDSGKRHPGGDMFGRQLVPGTGVALEIVVDLLAAGESVEAVSREFSIPEDVVRKYASEWVAAARHAK